MPRCLRRTSVGPRQATQTFAAIGVALTWDTERPDRPSVGPGAVPVRVITLCADATQSNTACHARILDGAAVAGHRRGRDFNS
jgi:hypothetical protein